MSNDDTTANNEPTTNQVNSGQNTTTAEPEKGRKPDNYVNEVFRKDGRDQFKTVGAVWHGKQGYLSGESNGNRIVLQSREAKEALDKMRAEKQQAAQAQQQPAQKAETQTTTNQPSQPSIKTQEVSP